MSPNGVAVHTHIVTVVTLSTLFIDTKIFEHKVPQSAKLFYMTDIIEQTRHCLDQLSKLIC